VTFTFNLVDAHFIPVVLLDGAAAEWGLRETLLRAHEAREVRDASPLVTVALQRLLLAVLHRIFGPKNAAAWGRLWQAGRCDAAPLDAYFTRWRERFDLFHPQHPFFQTAGFRTKEPSPVNRLAHEQASGNNATLFDHSSDQACRPLTPAEAARLVVAQQAFAVGGGKSETGYTAHAPLMQGLVVLPQGANLYETLMLNLVEYNAHKPFPAEHDAPAWEQDDPPGKQRTRPRGYLDYLTWQSRSLALHPEQCGAGCVVSLVSYAQGMKLEAPELFDPMMAYRRDEKAGWRALRLSEDRELWRDSAALFQIAKDGPSKRPECFDWLQAQVNEGFLSRRQRYDFAVFGLCTDKAKVHFWRHERMPLPLAYLDDADLVKSLGDTLASAEDAARALRDSVHDLATTVLAPAGGRPDKDRVRAFVNSLAPERPYWPRLEVPFRRLVVTLAEAAGDPDTQGRTVAGWACGTLRSAAFDCFEQVAGSLDQSARLLRAVAKARQTLRAELGRLLAPFREVTHAPSA
jgi:CRISPR system Cascade subunit CasA